MLFNSNKYLIFLVVIFIFYWFFTHKKLRYQNSLLLVSSYFFYSCWDFRFLFLLIFSTFLDYYTGLKIEKSENEKYKKIWLWLSVSINLSFLGFFKYYNFFIDSFREFLAVFGLEVNSMTLNIILPVGISFYTFHGLSYVIDIYNKKIKAERNFIDYSVFVSFFPLLVAGPIERATHLLPQIKKARFFNYSKATDGLRQILWGLFKKVVIADSCAEYANMIFNNSSDFHGIGLFLGAIFFTIQIYGDFSGYSDIAIGTAKLFGIDLIRNFNYPYFSRDIAEFWRRWHISLSSWFRDYLYIPLGGSKVEKWVKVRNTFIIFIISGFWHGSNWTFIFWGLLNAIYILPSILTNKNRSNIEIVASGKILPTFRDAINIISTFCLTVFAWIFFRSENISFAILYIKRIFIDLFNFSSYAETFKFMKSEIDLFVIILVVLFFITEWLGRESEHPLKNRFLKLSNFSRYGIYYLLILLVYLFNGKGEQFIYFQF
jgi:alginate O-acetyltransferase complex protein AlgI